MSKYTKKIEALKLKIEKQKERLYLEQQEQNRKFSNLGWGAGMRRSKISISTSKEDTIKERIERYENALKVLLKEENEQNK